MMVHESAICPFMSHRTALMKYQIQIEYTDSVKRRQITIPSGTEITSLIDDNGYTGFRYLISKGYETDYWEGRLTKK